MTATRPPKILPCLARRVRRKLLVAEGANPSASRRATARLSPLPAALITTTEEESS